MSEEGSSRSFMAFWFRMDRREDDEDDVEEVVVAAVEVVAVVEVVAAVEVAPPRAKDAVDWLESAGDG